MHAATAILMTLLVIVPDDKPATAKIQGDLASLQGAWIGKYGPQNMDISMDVKGDKLIVAFAIPNDPEQKFVVNGIVKIDETKQPKEWDFLNGVSNEGRKLPDGKAIYEIDGDVLKLCNALPGAARPTEIKDTKPETPQTIIFYRVKKNSGNN